MALANPESDSTAAEHKSQPVLLLRNVKDKGENRIERFALEKFRLAIGRSPDDDICLSQGSGVSRNHASVFVLDGEVVIEDLGSRNGTYVNKKLIRGNRQTTLKFGDVIMIGRYRLKLVDEAATSEVEAQPDVQALLRMWHPAAVFAVGETCGLCHSPHLALAQSEELVPEEQRTAEALLVDTVIGHGMPVRNDNPTQGRLFGRKLPRRPKPGKQRVSTKRTVMSPVKRSSRSRGHVSARVAWTRPADRC